MKTNPVVIFRTTSKCNLNCTYCYIDKKDKSNQQEELDVNNISRVIKYLKRIYLYPEKKCRLILHGGEPLIIKPNVYEKFFKELVKSFPNIILSIQTNGVNLNKEYIRIFKKYNVHIGISIDGFNDETNKYRVYRNGKNSFKRVFSNIKLLKEYDMKFGIIMTISKIHLGYEKNLYDFIANNDLSVTIRAAFSNERFNEFLLNNHEYFEFFSNLFKIWYSDRKEKVKLKQISDIYELFLIAIDSRYRPRTCSTGGKCFGDFLSLDASGNIYSCNRAYGQKDFYYGNIENISLNTILSRASEMEKKRKRKILMDNKCNKCTIFEYCNGGCPANSYNLYGNYMMPEKYFCDARIKLYNYIRNELIEMGDVNTYNEYRTNTNEII